MSALRGIGYGRSETLEFFANLERARILKQVNLRATLGLVKMPFGRFDMHSGLIRPKRFKQVLENTFGGRRLEDLTPKTLFQATDVRTGEGVILEKGPLADAVYASSALFPIFPPVAYNGRVLSDGYYTSPLPVSEAVKRNMDVIIAMLFYDPVDEQADSYIACLSNYYTIQGFATTRFQLAISMSMHDHEIIIIKVPFKNPVNIWDAHYIPEIIENGRVAIEARKEDILSAIESYDCTQSD